MNQKIFTYLETKLNILKEECKTSSITSYDDNYFEEILSFENFIIKLTESRKQIELFVSPKDNNWISMYWIAKYLKINYKILNVSEIDNYSYEETLIKQIDYITKFLKENIEKINNLFATSNFKKIDEEITNIAIKELKKTGITY